LFQACFFDHRAAGGWVEDVKEIPFEVIWKGPVFPDPEPVVLLELEIGDSINGAPKVTSPPVI
jgi:hypothetical protein